MGEVIKTRQLCLEMIADAFGVSDDQVREVKESPEELFGKGLIDENEFWQGLSSLDLLLNNDF